MRGGTWLPSSAPLAVDSSLAGLATLLWHLLIFLALVCPACWA